jgi:hypothetical protein
MVAKKRTMYLSTANPEGCFWQEHNSPRLDAMPFLFHVNHNVLVLLVKLIKACEWCEGDQSVL